MPGAVQDMEENLTHRRPITTGVGESWFVAQNSSGPGRRVSRLEVDQILEQKYGSGGAYGNRTIFNRPYQRAQDGKTYLAEGERYTTDAIAYTREVCHYIYDTYGRFPAHVDAFYQPGTWLQICHLEMEYYEQFFDPRLHQQQAQHQRVWHD